MIQVSFHGSFLGQLFDSFGLLTETASVATEHIPWKGGNQA
ncbi:hypothetical protein AB0L06_31605 [Spirillospora sp. NPDC052269]